MLYSDAATALWLCSLDFVTNPTSTTTAPLTHRCSFVQVYIANPVSSDSQHADEQAVFKVARLKSAYSGSRSTDYITPISSASTPPLAVQSSLRRH